jgi:hypothetical protein
VIRSETTVISRLRPATGMDVGLLLNFGAQSLQFKRKSRHYRPSDPTPRDQNSDSGGEFRL